LSFLGILEFNKYFFTWARKPEVKSEFTAEYVEIGKYLNSLPEDFEKYVIVNRGGVPVSFAKNIPMPAQTIMFLEISKYGEIKSHYLLPQELEKIKVEKKGVILPLVCEKTLIEKLEIFFPEGKIKRTDDFCVYVIEK
jgi:hypothetical protein